MSTEWYDLDSVDLSDKYGETTFSNAEVFMLGEALISWIGTSIRLGHASPASTLDYTTDPSALGLGGVILRDVIAWTSGRVKLAPGAEARLRELFDNARVDEHLASRLPSLGGAA